MTEVEGWRLHAWAHPPRWEAFDVPEPGPQEVLVRVEACGVGLTVLNCMNGDLDDSPGLLPLTPGHEMVGRVLRTGVGVLSPQPGDRVMAYFYLSCFRCRACLSGHESRCEALGGWYGVHRDGGYAALTVLPGGNALPVSEEVPAADATAIPDAIATPVHVCRARLGLRPGDRVAVIGAGGGVGVHMVQVARAFGAVVAGLEPAPAKLALAAELGAIPLDSSDLSAVALEEFGGRADAIIDLVGTADTLAWGLDTLDVGGKMCVLTTFRDVSFEVDPRCLVFKESSIVGSRYASRAELLEAAALVAKGSVRPVIGAVARPQEVEDIHAMLRDGTLRGRGAIVWD